MSETGSETPAADEEGEEGEQQDADSGVPEAYEFDVPEGFTLADEVREQASAAFKEAEFNQSQAKAVTDLYIGLQQSQVEAQATALRTSQNSWKKAVREDPVIGGDNLPTSQAHAAAAVKGFDSGKAFMQLLKTLGDVHLHPTAFAFLREVGMGLGEDSSLTTHDREGDRVDDTEQRGRTFYEGSMGATDRP